MNKILLGTVALAMLATPALADGRHRGYQGGRSGGWAAPLVGGLILGGAVGYYGYNRYWHTECRLEPVYDRWGNIVADQEVCYRVQN
jgi:hypothetical protein